MSTQHDRAMALAAFARLVGVAEGAVRSATQTGRLERSLVRVRGGRLKIGDVPLALREWKENCDESKVRP